MGNDHMGTTHSTHGDAPEQQPEGDPTTPPNPRRRDSPSWAEIRTHLNALKKRDLVEAMKALFESSADCRAFLAARLLSKSDGGAALKSYRKKIVDQFYPDRGFGKLKLGVARKAIRDYRKAADDLSGTLELMMTFVETATEFTRDFGDINEGFYNSADSVLSELVQLLKKPGRGELYAHFRDRLQELARRADCIGWGYGDSVEDQVEGVERYWSGRTDEQ